MARPIHEQLRDLHCDPISNAAVVALIEWERRYWTVRKQRDDLLTAARQIVWKLSHNHSPSGKGNDCVPGRIDRRDITVKLLEAAVLNAS